MGELAGEIVLPEYTRRPQSLDLITPLIAHLDSLPNNSSERDLSWAEDEKAIGILHSLMPDDNRAGKKCIAEFTQHSYRRGRTLLGWYLMAKHVLVHFESGNCCHGE